jgi:hypothetical protein
VAFFVYSRCKQRRIDLDEKAISLALGFGGWIDFGVVDRRSTG